jgi:hypothetical protein
MDRREGRGERGQGDGDASVHPVIEHAFHPSLK